MAHWYYPFYQRVHFEQFQTREWMNHTGSITLGSHVRTPDIRGNRKRSRAGRRRDTGTLTKTLLSRTYYRSTQCPAGFEWTLSFG